ncbi:hypothetical protein Tco_0347448 [Tanacetum coccineum]
MSIVLHEKLSGNLQSSTKVKPRGNDETIFTSVKADKPSIRRIDASQYVVSNLQNRNLFSESNKITLPYPNHLNDDYWDELKENDGEKDLEAHYTNAKPLDKALPRKEKDPRSFTLPCFIKNMCHKALADLGASTIMSTAHTVINVFKAKITLSIGNDKIFFKSNKPTSNIIKRVYALSLIKSTKLDLEARLMGNALRKNRLHDPKFEDHIELSEVYDTPIKEIVKTRHDDDKSTNGIEDYPSFSDPDRKIHVNDAYNLRFFCIIGYEHVDANFFRLLSINMMSKRFYNSIMKDKLEFKGKSVVGAFMNAPIFVGTISVVTDFAVMEDMDRYRDKEMGDVIVGKEFYK